MSLIKGEMPEIEHPEQECIWMCLQCGKQFDSYRFSHGRAVPDQDGDPIEMECGPIEAFYQDIQEPKESHD